MIKNYFTIAWRHLRRHTFFAALNSICLAIGICFSIIIGVFVFREKQVNTTLKRADSQYFLKSIYKQKDQGLDITSISPLAKAVKEEYPNLVANYYRYNPVTNVVSSGDKHFKENIAIGDTTLVTMYGFPLLYGDKYKAFHNNNSAVITGNFAMKMFGTTNAVGKVISLQTTIAGVSQEYSVSAVLKDLPFNSVTNLVGNDYSIFIPTTGSRFFKGEDPSLSWDNTNELSFIELKPGINPASLRVPLNALLKKYSADFVWKNMTADLVPVKSYYLLDNGGAVNKLIMILSLVAIFILLMVVINFININIGTATYRLKEIGLRKTFGSERKQIAFQFMAEAYLLTVGATVLSLLLYQMLIPVFSQVLQTRLPAFWEFHLVEYVGILILMVVVGFLAGIYPALILSNTDLVQAVKGKISNSTGGLRLKQVLLVTQFSLAILVFICSVNLSRQVDYIFHKDLGYNKDQLLVITAFPKNWDSSGVMVMNNIKQQLEKLPFVTAATLTFDLPEGTPAGRIILYPPKGKGLDNQVNLALSSVDEDFAKTFGISLKAGSFFAGNKDGIVVNEKTVQELGLTNQNAIGQRINTGMTGFPLTITGIVTDFNFSSLQEKIGPIGFIHMSQNHTYRFLALKLHTDNMANAVETIRKQWKAYSPLAPFDFTFMDEKFASLYSAELRLQKAADVATVLNLLIVLLGIIGVVSFMLNKRGKEIAVRKVLGANAGNIIQLFLKEYAVLLVIANLIAWPLAYFISDKLLQGFAYRIDQTWISYLIVFASISFISFLVIILQCFKTAVANPVTRLRTE